VKNFLFYLVTAFLLSSVLMAEESKLAQDKFKEAIAYFEKQNYEQALPILQKLSAHSPQNNLYRFNLANVYYKLKNYEQAREEYGKVSSKSPLVMAAKLYIAKSFASENKIVNSIKILIALNKSTELSSHIKNEVRSDLSKQCLKQALFEYKNNNTTKALNFINNSIEAVATARAYLLKGIILTSLKQNEESKAAFNEAWQRAQDEQIKKQAQDFLKLVEQKTEKAETQKGWVSLTLGVGQNSNYYMDSNNAEEKNNVSFGVDTGRKFMKYADFSTAIIYGIAWNEVIGEEADRLISNYVGLSLQILNDDWNIKLVPSYGFQFLESETYLLRPGISFSAARSFSDMLEIGFSHSYVEYRPWIEDYEAQSGHYNGGSAGIKFYSKKYYVGINYLLLEEDLKVAILDNGTFPQKYSASGFQAYFFWLITKEFSLDAGATILQKDYTPAATNPSKVRNDEQNAINLKFSYHLNKSTQFFLSGDYVINDSSLESGDVADKNYEQMVVFSGLVWDIL